MTTPTAILTIPKISKEFLYVPGVEAFAEGTSDAMDPTALPVVFAFIAPRTFPVNGDWQNGEWTPGRTDQVQILLDSVVLGLTYGTYAIWLRINGAVEQPTRLLGQLLVV